MNISALLTSAGINIGVCVLLFSLYSVLRKQPGNVSLYFGRKLAQEKIKQRGSFHFERFVPSPSWIVKAWKTSEEEILASAGLDAVVFLRILVFSIRIFSIAAVICMLLVLPLNYHGQEMHHKKIPSESLDVFTIGNVEEGSRWLWAHCLALYIISCSACILLYFEYKRIAKMRLEYISRSSSSPSQFSVLVRSIPRSPEESYSDLVRNFFTKYHASSYLSHQMVYRSGTVQKLMRDAEKMYKVLHDYGSTSIGQTCRPSFLKCGPCQGTLNCFKMLPCEPEHSVEKPDLEHLDSSIKDKECGAAFVFFRTRYAAVVASHVLQSSNPMLWVTDLAPEPEDVYWSNLSIPCRLLWLRQIATLLASFVFTVLFLIPVTLVQGLTQLEQLQQNLPFLRGILKKTYVSQLVTGYLPSVILLLFLYIVPPLMMLFSAVEGSISHSGRKKSACCKVLYFTIWNVFFVNVLSGSVIGQLKTVISKPRTIPAVLATAVPRQAAFFTTYVLTSGWAGLACEVVQIFSLICSLFCRCILRRKDILFFSAPSFPYHTQVPRVLLFVLLGFTCSILVPLILPFLLVYFFLGYLVYRNQILNVYLTRYETGGQYWPIVHNTMIFSLVLAHIIAIGVFGLKRSPVASGFTIPLAICTLLFNEYCRRRFHPIFKIPPAEVLIEMDQQDEQSGQMAEIYQKLQSAYCQFTLDLHNPFFKNSSAEQEKHRDRMAEIHQQLQSAYSQLTLSSNTHNLCKAEGSDHSGNLCKAEGSNHSGDVDSIQDPEDTKPGFVTHKTQ
ncbi:CSC1-like protein RXW8 isoform X2 [Macadamia integrifolia]|uniref:CSC1-like protein RXW8 isoform X2 n=1 Tax=Macadamia integrifolia TaxID=60698 RepID=UPI001C4F56A2|nr:CSC1-like protein RXW8 isoform X2 [Macadamia integrifolia]